MLVSDLESFISGKFNCKTLHKCSEDDDHGVFLVQNQDIPVYDFDEIKVQLVKSKEFIGCDSLTSPDTLYFNSKSEIFFIEFKNSSYTNIDKPKLRAKLYEAIILLKHKFKFTEINKITYIIVHKDSDRKPKTHKIKEGRCPKDLGILKTYFPINVKVYEAGVFNGKCYSILGHNQIPIRS